MCHTCVCVCLCVHHVLRSNIETGRGLGNFGHPCMFGLVLEHCGLVLGGGKIHCSKNRVLAVLRAYCVFGARQVFETNFGHIQNFW